MFQELLTLFVSSFVSATLFPGASELLLIYYVQNTPSNVYLYLLSAIAGNSLGALVTFYMGYYLNWGRDKVQRKHETAWLNCQRYGVFTLLFSWLPVIGDILPLAAGWLRLAMLPSVIFIIVGKTIRYWVIVSATLHWL